MNDCPLCSVLKEKNAQYLTENNLAFAMLNFAPIAEGHVMILPKRHIFDLADMTAEESKAVNDLMNQMMNRLDEMYGINPVVTINGARYRTQEHLHIHIIPTDGDYRDLYEALTGDEKRRRASDEELERVNAKILMYR